MNILFLSRSHDRARCVSLGNRRAFITFLVVLVTLPLAGMYAGYKLGLTNASPSVSLDQEIERQRMEIGEAKRLAQDNLDALALRLGQMQAHVMRLNALGQRLTRVAKLDKGEFNFNREPAQGGPVEESAAQPIKFADFMQLMDDLSRQVEDRARQLDVLETMLINRNLQAEVFPSGSPSESGWISSQFGVRVDPFHGRSQHHNGIDLAGKEGSEVLAAASGVVTWAADRAGYGQLVEINHGNGYTTRYGHNEKILVKVGQPVRKGQALALMGSTGRSTGPHIHFEVWRHGRAVDPLPYMQGQVQASR